MRFVNISNKLFAGLILLALVGLMGCCYTIYAYSHLRQQIAQSNVLEDKVHTQRVLIHQQQNELRAVSHKLYRFKKYIDKIDDFEDRVVSKVKVGKSFDLIRMDGMGGAGSAQDQAGAFIVNRHTLMDDISEQLIELHHASQKTIGNLKMLLGEVKKQMAIPSIRPAQGWISSNYGYRISPFTGKRQFHRGLDIANRKGTPIVAAASGKIIRTRVDRLFGNYIMIDHANGFVTRYAHLSKILRKKGDLVRKGDVIAEIGNTGRSTGPHLHYEVHRNGKSMDPRRFIP